MRLSFNHGYTENIAGSVIKGAGRRAKGILFAVATLTMAAGQPQYAAAANDQTLIVAIEAEPSQLDPHISGSWNTFRIIYHMFESLVAQDLTRDDLPQPPIVPALAESWKISDDGLTYTFTLRQGVTFHDGTPWNSTAAVFNFDRMMNEDAPHYNAIAGPKLRWVLGDVESYRALDDVTFEIKLKNRNSEFLRRLTQGGVGSVTMVSPAAVERYGNDGLTNHPVGTGPFKFVERVFGEKVVLEANDSYWNKARHPKVGRIMFRGISELATRELALQTGEVDIIATPSPDSVQFLNDQGFKIVKGPVSTVYVLWLNTKDPHFQDKRVRQAVAMAIDREGMAKHLKRGLAIPSYGLLNYGGPGHDPDFRDYPYDPEKAKQLLAEAGYPEGFETRMDWTLGGGGDVDTGAEAQWIQRNLEKIGIKASIELFDNNTYWDMLGKGAREGTGMMSVSWGETGFFWLDVVASQAALPPKGFNVGYYDNPKIDELLRQAEQAATEEEQVAKLRETNRIISDDAAILSYYTPIQVYAMQPNVDGLVMAPQHWQDLTTITKN
ncbi:putative peptide/opine/nickel uptake family protein ABC transporter, periplasmic substrate-binding protein (plasmid) [Sinorhizobium fredii HH103]|uniref:Peptide/opine/nickel uptake family protein ABC transporter, periplasmic substrate-binding protein n=1 Tax=Sinorhizobium fredii (strain HH103) TaxID=1117943 RepID=G9AJ78_SINF1|nr:ABC transporter substrate-binding protein [Sinorhizobium fredii]CCF01110.1 putative peptide/opine/nickel uptake family protein ABC transporter, periplasmic substrate-binding protein [Sinorhizobium fredii HH103]